ncbi:CPBP family glutamic-type intramembrane protease [Microbacterium hominis]|uniref:CPBP family intramembrane metalloprotease n=1 Tax=Microbacterium hominis TaxID=162426 RepID=A0A7D4PW21_9MICO|nr:CPBP family glutamic-type intramembrane protease [Microbacterium hominis]QKJ20234.1 CPBP family intramembrane metalloprotease [Microbacterium hominis]
MPPAGVIARGAVFARPGAALLIAAGGFALAALVLLAYPTLSRLFFGLGATESAIVDLVLVSTPLVAAVIVAAVIARGGAAAGIHRFGSWVWIDAASGIAVGLLARAIVELVAPTTGSLAGPFGPPDTVTIVVIALGVVVVTPVVEELFFRGLLQRSLAQVLARPVGAVAAAVASVLASVLGFVALHALAVTGPIPLGLIVGSVTVGLGCALLTVLTGRIGGAIVAHVVSNALGLALLLS